MSLSCQKTATEVKQIKKKKDSPDEGFYIGFGEVGGYNPLICYRALHGQRD